MDNHKQHSDPHVPIDSEQLYLQLCQRIAKHIAQETLDSEHLVDARLVARIARIHSLEE